MRKADEHMPYTSERAAGSKQAPHDGKAHREQVPSFDTKTCARCNEDCHAKARHLERELAEYKARAERAEIAQVEHSKKCTVR